MTAMAYLMIVVVEDCLNSSYREIVNDLKVMPELKLVERVSGTCEFVAKIEVAHPKGVIQAADKLLAKRWVRNLQVLNVEPLLLAVKEGAINAGP